ncbi:MAG: hypothetical protein M1825_000566 [Sarcosagium campestre]|nr:MAG: hypothetical protein M1825_000566 [Sarcosagium campestre]
MKRSPSAEIRTIETAAAYLHDLPRLASNSASIDRETTGSREPTGINTPAVVVVGGYPTAPPSTMYTPAASVMPEASPADAASVQPEPERPEGLNILGQGVKKLVKIIHNLRQVGVEDLVLPLPKIVVVGDQSTGKSSLIEGLSEIKVPRDAGTCTRCPLEINLTESAHPDEQWACTVTLVKKFIYEPIMGDNLDQDENQSRARQRASRAPSRARPFGHFIPQQPEEYFFQRISDRDAVEDTLRWAQLATLNPHADHRRYIPGANADTSREERLVGFSPNVVRLNITGPHLPNLSFYDLPGVINQAENHDEQHLVTMVRNLVKEYIKSENSLVLLAVPMTDDTANSSAAAVVKAMRAEDRTIGVLTKPDRMEMGDSYDQWRQILSGNLYDLGFGYFVTKQPAQASLRRNIDHAQARLDESAFFANTAPWSTEFREFSARFGTTRLQKFLSEKLTLQILKNLPYIGEQIDRKAESIDLELSELPEPPAENPQFLLSRKLHDFHGLLQVHIDGDHDHPHFQKSWYELVETFRREIELSRPTMRFSGASEARRRERNMHNSQGSGFIRSTPTRGARDSDRSTPIELIEVRDDDEEMPSPAEVLSQESPSRKRPRPNIASDPRKRLFTSRNGASVNATDKLGKEFTLEEIRDACRNGYTGGIPDLVDPRAIVHLSRQSVLHWVTPMEKFVEATGSMLRNLVLDRFYEILGNFKETQLFVEAPKIMNEFMDEVLNEQLRQSRRIYDAEILKPLTTNRAAHEWFKREALGVLQARRLEYRVLAEFNNIEWRGGKVPEGPAREKELQRIRSQMPEDEFAREMEHMATVRGYYATAMSRFVDCICLRLQADMFVQVKERLEDLLVNQLGIMKPDGYQTCARLLAEDPSREIKRAQLKRERDRLEKGHELLARLATE